VAADGEGDVGAQRAGNDGDDWRLAGDGLYAALGVACLPFPFDAEVLRRLAEVIFAEAGARDLRQGRRIFLDQAGAARWINEDEIVFVEYVARRVVIHLRKEVIEYKYMPLSMFARQLSAQFVQVHQSYVVNVQAVRGFDRRLGVLRLAGLAQPVPVGRSYQRRVVELLRGKLEE
jgi:DNA-binding LytR/AlgR family response regulator